jgi:hypothetical protein
LAFFLAAVFLEARFFAAEDEAEDDDAFFFAVADFLPAFIVAPAACAATSVSSAVLLTINPAVVPTVRAIVVSRLPVIVGAFFFAIRILQISQRIAAKAPWSSEQCSTAAWP